MSPLSLILAGLRRNPVRSLLTVASLAVAFLLFLLLRALLDGLSGGGTATEDRRLIVDAKYSMTDNVPMAHVHSIAGFEGVAATAAMVWFGGYYQDPKQSFTTLAVNPDAYLSAFRELHADPAALAEFRQVRRAVLVHESLVAKHGWEIGQVIPMFGDIWPKEDGSWDWEFVLAGSYTLPAGSRVPRAFLLNLDYFHETVADWVKDQAGWVVIRLDESADSAAVARAIDGRFENSSDPTKTMSEDAYAEEMADQLGDLGMVAGLILAAVFFTLLLLTANVVSLSFRERITELATLKALGFQDGRISIQVLSESLILCATGAVVGIVTAYSVEPLMSDVLIEAFGSFQIRPSHLVESLLVAMLLGCLVGLPPTFRAWRLPVAQTLRELD